MCLITFHYAQHERYKLVLAANRDEVYSRASAGAHFWPSHPYLLAGKDLEANGTWLGITKDGRIAAITNCHGEEFMEPTVDKRSRGQILTDYLTQNESADVFIQELIKTKDHYQPFNVLLGTIDALYHFNSHDEAFTALTKGTHSLSNATLNTPWPKVKKTRRTLDLIIHSKEDYLSQLFKMMMDKTPAPDNEIPDAPLPLAIRQKASANFIETEKFGTKSTTILLVDWDNNVTYVERTYLPNEQFEDRTFNFQIKSKSNAH